MKWNVGVLEYWSIGFIHCSMTPPLQYSIDHFHDASVRPSALI
jgi:hypothetical protein